MKKIITIIFFLSVTFLIFLITLLSLRGIETNKFNKMISNKASQSKSINLDLSSIRFKLDIRELSLFLETRNTKVNYKNVSLPIKNLKVYIDFLSLLKSDPKIKKADISLEELNIVQLNKLSSLIKPSNFKSVLNNKIKRGKLISEIEIFFTEEGTFKDFIARGEVLQLEAELLSGLTFQKGNLNFIADTNDILLKNIFGNLENVKISEGDLKLNLENGIKLSSNFNSKIDYDKNSFFALGKVLKKNEILENIYSVSANLSNNISIDFDSTYKIKNYSYSISGNLEKGEFQFPKNIKNIFKLNDAKKIYLSNFQIKTLFIPKIINFSGKGEYSLNNKDFLNIVFENDIKNKDQNLKLNLDFKENFKFELINFEKNKNSVANLSLDLEKKNNNFRINKINLKDGNNSIKINDLIFKNDKFLTFKKMEVITANNDFSIQIDKKIKIRGNKFDATNIAKFLNKKSNVNNFQQINGKIEIDFKNILVPVSERLRNFKLLGEIKKGKFVKISSKGDFGGNNFIDITMRDEKETDKKFLEIYSDLTRPLLAEFSFFDGLSGGNLLFSSVIDGKKSSSQLKIENFKVINAPGVIQLLSLADLGGLADLAAGEGLSFDLLEINMEKDKDFLKINELLALGPSMSVLIEGYQESNGLTSLRGTLVPAKTLNKMISKIPVIGKIIIPKEVGEGLFGISFKMKGHKGKIKTTINPIRTLTPRFIQKIIEKNKVTK